MLPTNWQRKIQQLKMFEITKTSETLPSVLSPKNVMTEERLTSTWMERQKKLKWKLIKSHTGQQNIKTPEIIKEGNTIHTKPRDIANALNQLYISNVRTTISKIPSTTTNPMDHNVAALGPVSSKFNLSQINMSKIL